MSTGLHFSGRSGYDMSKSPIPLPQIPKESPPLPPSKKAPTKKAPKVKTEKGVATQLDKQV